MYDLMYDLMAAIDCTSRAALEASLAFSLCSATVSLCSRRRSDLLFSRQ